MNRPRRNTGLKSTARWGKALQRHSGIRDRPGATEFSTFDQDRPGPLRSLAFAHDAKPLGHLGIGLDQSTEVAPEAVLVELFVGLDIPQPAGVRRDFVGD